MFGPALDPKGGNFLRKPGLESIERICVTFMRVTSFASVKVWLTLVWTRSPVVRATGLHPFLTIFTENIAYSYLPCNIGIHEISPLFLPSYSPVSHELSTITHTGLST